MPFCASPPLSNCDRFRLPRGRRIWASVSSRVHPFRTGFAVPCLRVIPSALLPNRSLPRPRVREADPVQLQSQGMGEAKAN